MATCSCSKAPPRKTGISRYKGIETLMRRIAFNLGNTPSQTEVKIISCIPIDVTDLQSKIQCLEKQLEKLHSSHASDCKDKEEKAVLPLLVDTIAFTNTNSKDPNSSTQPSSFSDPQNKLHKNRHKRNDFSRYLDNDDQYKVKKSLSYEQLQAEPQNVFGEIIPERDRTRLVYYTQTTADSSPCKEDKKAPETKQGNNPDKIEDTMNAEYLQSLIERQHLVKMYMDDDMLGSQGSVPVCRDVPCCSGTSDDMCSCCRGNFLDVDCKIRKRPVFDFNIDSGNVHYDSSLCDMKPVKEKPRLKKNELIKKRRTPEMNCLFYPEYYRFKPECSLIMDMLPNVCSRKPVKLQKGEHRKKQVLIPNESSVTDGLVEFSHVYQKRLSPKHGLRYNTDKPVPKDAECNALSRDTTKCHVKTSKPNQTLSVIKVIPSSNLDEPLAENAQCVQPTNNIKCPVPLTKALQTSSLSKFGSTHTSLKVTLRNAACLAVPAHEIECQTDLKGAHSDFTKNPEPDKTESTLNQIKTMLETVLTEVKTNNTNSGLRVTSEKETKDAIVQNEPISNTECERVLNSFTYSPYALINPYVPSYSHPLPSYCSSIMRQPLTLPRQTEVPRTLNYAQNFPELVHQTVAAHTYHPERNLMQPKQMSTCATNTMHETRKRSTETENLIKEIYKSMKLDVEYPVKSASRSAINDAKSKNEKTSPEREAPKKMTLGREEMIFRGDMGNRRVIRMESPSESSLNARQKRRGGSFHQAPMHTTSAQRRQGNVKKPNKETPESLSGSESDSDDEPFTSPAIDPSKPAKKGFFGKVMSSVVNKMRRKEAQNVDNRMKANTQDSDTSDEAPVQRDRPVKHVSYAPAEHQHWTETSRPMSSSSKTRRLRQSSYRRAPDRPMHQPQRMPRYVPRSVLRPHSGSSQIRRTIYRPQAPHRPRTPPEYMKRLPYNQYDWRTTPTRSVHRMQPVSTNAYQPKVPAKSPGLKITNKTWMRKPVYHLGFACGPEKEKIMMQY